jgi:transglutaminase-like putative cysteine protease
MSEGDTPLGPTERRLRVVHNTTYAHEQPVELAHHIAFLIPRDSPQQRVLRWKVDIDPLPDNWAAASWEAERQLSRDPWGNARLVFSHAQVHQELRVCSRFDVAVSARAVLDTGHSPAWETVAQTLRYHVGPDIHPQQAAAVEFSLPSPFAAPDAALTAYARQAFQPGLPLAQGAFALMQQIHADFAYAPLATHVGTRASEALRLRRGVCQDFAQVLVAACRGLGLAARYVSGYLLTHPPAGQPRLIGADASHAWAEVWCPVQGWMALDPTNNMAVGQDHVLLAWGRDYADVAPLRGVVRGGTQSAPLVAVTVTPA